MSGKEKKKRRKYRVRPRFFVIIAVMLLMIVVLVWSLYSVHVRNNRCEYETGREIAGAARIYIANKDLVYNSSYIEGGYPPADIGVCTDVVWNALRGFDVDLRQLVSSDIYAAGSAYRNIIDVPDNDIDFRRVDVLEVYMNRHCKVLDRNVNNLLAWMPGDIVTFESSHVAVVSDFTNIWGRPLIIQHGKDPAAEEDHLISEDGMEISGHFRWPVNNWDK